MWNCCHLGAHSVCTIQPCTSLQCLFIWSHVCWVHVCSAVTCHLHFWQNDWDLLHATVVTWGGMDTEISVSTENWSWRRRSAAPAGTWTHDLLILSPVRYHWAIHAHLFTSVSQSESFVLSCVKRKSVSFVTKSCMIGVRLYEIDPYLRESGVSFPRVRALCPISSYACGMRVWGRECLLFWMAVHGGESVGCKSLRSVQMQYCCSEGVCIVYFPQRNTGHFHLLSLCDVEQLPLQSVCKELIPLSCCRPFKTMKTARLVYVRYRQISVMMLLVGIWADHVSRGCLLILILTYLVQRRDWKWRSCNSLFTWCKDEMEDQIW